MSGAPTIAFDRLTATPEGHLSVAFDVTGTRHTRVTVLLSTSGAVLDVQALDHYPGGTTGDPALDERLVDVALKRLGLARDAEAYRHAVEVSSRRRSAYNRGSRR